MFPESLKIAKVIPVFKEDDPTLFSNYRPISILPAFEKAMYNRLINFLNLYNILYSKQFGFRNNHSTALALIDLINNISSAIDRNETTLGIFLDLSKVFDTINHEILCQKLVFGILLWCGSKAILRIGLNLSSLGPIDLIRGKFYVASRRAQFLDLFCLLFTLMIFLMSLVSLNLYCLLMTQESFVPIKMPTTLFLLLTMNLQK